MNQNLYWKIELLLLNGRSALGKILCMNYDTLNGNIDELINEMTICFNHHILSPGVSFETKIENRLLVSFSGVYIRLVENYETRYFEQTGYDPSCKQEWDHLCEILTLRLNKWRMDS